MKTAQEKAEEILSRYIDAIPEEAEMTIDDAKDLCRECALIAVDEILQYNSEWIKSQHEVNATVNCALGFKDHFDNIRLIISGYHKKA